MLKARTKLLLVLLLLVVAAPLAATGNDLQKAQPEDVGLSTERLDRLSKHMSSRVEDGTMVGGLAMIARKGKVVYSETWGQRDREAGQPMTMDTIFRIYSMSKPITSVAVMMLYEEGHFFLNDPVAKYIPELADLRVAVSTAGGTAPAVDGTRAAPQPDNVTDVPSGETREALRQPTIRDLLRHTGGFSYGVFGNTEVDQAYRNAGLLFMNPNLEDFVAKLGKIPLQYDPGTRWHYSVATDVLGRLVEVVSGKNFEEFLDERIFTPLAMDDTSFTVPKNKTDRFAVLYAPKGTQESENAFLSRNQSKELVPSGEFANRNFQEGATFQSGGGGLVSTASDYMRFSQMLLNGGALEGQRILSTKSVEHMSRNHLGDIPMGFGRTGTGFGLGFGVVLDVGVAGELGSDGEYNWGGAAGTRFWIDPEEEIIGVFMVQSLPHQTTLGAEFKTLTYQALID
ncbi:MAG: serine hydrolase domain-containing protein [Acidobacteriota bacterium]